MFSEIFHFEFAQFGLDVPVHLPVNVPTDFAELFRVLELKELRYPERMREERLSQNEINTRRRQGYKTRRRYGKKVERKIERETRLRSRLYSRAANKAEIDAALTALAGIETLGRVPASSRSVTRSMRVSR